ncbi:hypothetical protein GCM10028824_14040 [Hymenobacter segetis]
MQQYQARVERPGQVGSIVQGAVGGLKKVGENEQGGRHEWVRAGERERDKEPACAMPVSYNKLVKMPDFYHVPRGEVGLIMGFRHWAESPAADLLK